MTKRWIALACLLAAPNMLLGQSTWTGGVGNWTNAANWSAGVPADDSSSTIDNGGTAQVDSVIPEILGSVEVASAVGTTGNLELQSTGDLFANQVFIGQLGTATSTVTATASTEARLIVGGGGLRLGSNDETAAGVTGNGTLTVNNGGAVLAGTGASIQAGKQGYGEVTFNSGSYVNAGFIVVGKFGTGVWNQAGGIIQNRGGADFEIGDGGTPAEQVFPGPRNGTLNLTGGAIRSGNRFAIGNRIGTGEVNISGGVLAITGDGASEIGDGRENRLYIGRGADWTPAEVLANGVTGNSATLRVIGDDSVIAVGLDLEMDPNGVFESSNLIAQITGPTHTPILAGRNAKIKNGTFKVELDGYAPSLGDEWSIIQTNVDLTDAIAAFDAVLAAEDVTQWNRDGTGEQLITHNNNAFTNNPEDPGYIGVDGPFEALDFSAAPLAAGLGWEVEYLSDEVLLKVVATGLLPGDANADGMVDLVDLDILGQNFGTTSGATVGEGDFNGDGMVDLVDLDILGQNFGAGVGAFATPEPASVVLLLSLVGAGAAVRRRS